MGSVIGSVLSKFKTVFPSANERLLRKIQPIVEEALSAHERR